MSAFDQLIEMGFAQEQCRDALQATAGDVQLAAALLLENATAAAALPEVRRSISEKPYLELPETARQQVRQLGAGVTLRAILDFLWRSGEARGLTHWQREESPRAPPEAVRISDVVLWINKQGPVRESLWKIYNETVHDGRAMQGGRTQDSRGRIVPVWVAMVPPQPIQDEVAHERRRAQSEAGAGHPSREDQREVSAMAAAADEKLVKKLKKQLREIDELKRREAAGEHLEANHRKKLAGEPKLREQLHEAQRDAGMTEAQIEAEARAKAVAEAEAAAAAKARAAEEARLAAEKAQAMADAARILAEQEAAANAEAAAKAAAKAEVERAAVRAEAEVARAKAEREAAEARARVPASGEEGLRALLAQENLGQFADAVVTAGYDSPEMLKDMDDDELAELIIAVNETSEVKMGPGHKKKLKALRASKAAEAATATAEAEARAAQEAAARAKAEAEAAAARARAEAEAAAKAVGSSTLPSVAKMTTAIKPTRSQSEVELKAGVRIVPQSEKLQAGATPLHAPARRALAVLTHPRASLSPSSLQRFTPGLQRDWFTVTPLELVRKATDELTLGLHWFVLMSMVHSSVDQQVSTSTSPPHTPRQATARRR